MYTHHKNSIRPFIVGLIWRMNWRLIQGLVRDVILGLGRGLIRGLVLGLGLAQRLGWRLSLGITALLAGHSLAENTIPSAIQQLGNAERQQLKIIALAPHIVESLFEIGAGEQIIGTSQHADYPEAAKSILRVGNHASIQVEKVLQIQPDIIIAWQTGNPLSDLERLKKYQFEVIDSTPTTLKSVADELLMLGQLTGRQAKAQDVAKRYLTALNELENQYAHLTPVTLFYELWSRPLRTVANQAWPQQQIALCGASNPFVNAHEDYPAVSLEQALVSMPQVIIQPGQHGNDNPDHINWAKWAHIPASKNQFIFGLNADKVHRMTTRMLDEVKIMCEKIHQARIFYQTQAQAK